MNIQNISKKDQKVLLRLDSSELICLCNALYAYIDTEGSKTNQTYHRLYADLMVARDLSQYGHLDDFSFNCITEQRKLASPKKPPKT